MGNEMVMSEQEKRCGTCKWWSKDWIRSPKGEDYATCDWPMPYWVEGNWKAESDGEYCKVWELKGV